MKNVSLQLSLSVLLRNLFPLGLLAGTFSLLSGCASDAIFPSSGAVVATPQAALPGIQGSNYGGHAPLVGAHVYVVQPGTTGYGSVVTGLLSAGGQAKYPTTQNGSWTNSGFASDQFVPGTDASGKAFYGVTTDANGEFNITGDYSCTAGQPVFLIAYGGFPSYKGAGPNTFTIATEEDYNDGSGYWLTYTTTTAQLFYVGESVSVSGNTVGTGFNSSGTVVGVGKHYDGTAAPLTTTTFTMYFPYGASGLAITNTTTPSFPPSTLGTVSGVTVTATPTFNPAAVNMAMLGICPAAQTVATISGVPQGTSSYQLSGISASDIAKLVIGQQIVGPGVGPAGNPTTITAINSSTGTITMAALDTGPGAPPYTTSYSYTISASTFGPSSSTPINYVYMNEISTAAVAYSMNQYLNWSQNDQSNLNDEFHIGSPNNTQALTGIANAALTAGLLYDIQGSNIANANPDGDVHIARTATPSGTGTVPQTMLDTVGNILAACVDSANTYRLGTGTVSPQCKVLFQEAQDNGYVDTSATTHQAFNIAQAAFNIAHFPESLGTAITACGCTNGVQTYTAGNATTTTAYVTNLFNIPTGNVPFTPTMSTVPNDYSVAIQWNIGQTANNLEIDATGNAWAVAGVNGMYQITPTGTITNYTGTLTTTSKNLGGVAIDAVNGNIWANGVTGIYKYTAGTATGTLLGIGNSASGTSIAVDSSVNQYIGSGGATSGASGIAKQNSAGTAAGGNYPILFGYTANSAGACANAVGYVALDRSTNLWTATSNDIFNGLPTVCRFDSAGNLKYSLSVPTGVSGQAGGFGYPHGLATDATDNAFFPDKNLDALYKVTAGTTTANTGYSSLVLHGQLNAPKGVAVDGANTIWVANTGNLAATTGAKYATGLVQFSDALTLLSPTYITGATYTTTPTTSLGSVAIDPSGNIWSVQAQIDGGSAPTKVYEYVGLGAPTVTPIAAAKANNTVGVKP
jgi:hypothetical protein